MVKGIDVERRSENMRRIRSTDTKPEMLVRRCVYAMGYRYRLHARELPGKPDIVFRKKKKVIFVHGCFWHQHPKCREGRIPTSRKEYWRPKLERNMERDQTHIRNLKRMGWSVLIVWECELNDQERLHKRLVKFLD